MSGREKIKQPSLLKMIIKIIIVFLIVLFWYTLARTALEKIGQINDFRYNEADWVSMCDYEYYNKNYGMLKDTLMMRNSQEPEFDVYWEAVKGFEDYQMYLQYTKAVAAGMEEAAAIAEEYKQEVFENAQNCVDSRNLKQLEKYVQLLEEE